jgi:hypothetical protein
MDVMPLIPFLGVSVPESLVFVLYGTGINEEKGVTVCSNNPFPANFDILIQYPDNASTFWYPYHITSSTHDYIFEPFFPIALAYCGSCDGTFKCVFGIGGGNLRSSSGLDF